MRRYVLSTVAMLAGCNSLLGIEDIPVASDGAQAAVDAGIDGSGNGVCYGILSLCLDAAPTQPVVLPSTIDTSSAASCTHVIGDFCVIAGTIVRAEDRVRAVGARPLVIIAHENLQVANNATLDVSSTVLGGAGAGSGYTSCSITEGSATAGGAGGSFGSTGGRGGDAENLLGDEPGSAELPAYTVRGGCPGSRAGGAGGGAVYLVARGTISIEGAILASGAGGRGGVGNVRGGGGGGSGGMIALDAPSILLQQGSLMVANGGGGGGGAGANGATAANGNETSTVNVATGGSAADGGSGGNGGAATASESGVAGGAAKAAGAGGGGGGGGVGFIVLPANAVEVNAGQMSPMPFAI